MKEGSPKPKAVREAQVLSDVAALSRMGRIGGQRSAERREIRKDLDKERLDAARKDLDDLMAERAKLYSVNEEGDVLLPDVDVDDDDDEAL